MFNQSGGNEAFYGGSALGSENLKCTDWVEPEGDRALGAGKGCLFLEKQGLRKPKDGSSEMAKGLKKGIGRHSR